MEFVEAMDQALVGWAQALRSPGLDAVLGVLTWLGSGYVLTAVALAALAGWIRARPRWSAALPLVALLASSATTETVKALVQRPRPEVVNPGEDQSGSFSFPSGHSCSAAAVYGTLALLAAARLPRPWQRRLAVGVAGVLIVLVGWTRIYLGVHYLSDVLGGWAAGLAWAFLLAYLDADWRGSLTAPAPSTASDPPPPAPPSSDRGPSDSSERR